MAILVDTAHAGDFILSEGPGHYSRDEVIIDTGNLGPATVLAKITATGKFVQLAPAAADGSQNASAVLIFGGDATAADIKRAALTRHAQVNGLKLVWPAGITVPQKTAALVSLTSAGIIVR